MYNVRAAHPHSHTHTCREGEKSCERARDKVKRNTIDYGNGFGGPVYAVCIVYTHLLILCKMVLLVSVDAYTTTTFVAIPVHATLLFGAPSAVGAVPHATLYVVFILYCCLHKVQEPTATSQTMYVPNET